jgi:hypothetical protein
MTVGLPSALSPAPAPEPAGPAEPRRREVRAAAIRFEALLLQQLVQVMRSTVGEGGLFGSGAGSAMYAHLFDQNLADSLSSAGGLGMRAVIERSMLGPAAYAAQRGQAMETAPLRPFVPRVEGEVLPVRPSSGAPLPGLSGRLQRTADAMLGPRGFAPQWGREGRLTAADLASDFATEGPDGRAMFNVRDAAGFQGAYKCNLFAFELARRAGFMVPLVGRPRGWGYQGPDGVMADVAAGRLRGGWGRVVTGESAESLDSALVRGERAFLLTGTGIGDRAGHMGVVERIHRVDYDARGRIERIVFDGWEGRRRGATHLTRRTWNRYGNPGGEDARGGFERIEIVELRRPPAGQRQERPLHEHARPSVHDLERAPRPPNSSSRSSGDRPMELSEEPSP